MRPPGSATASPKGFTLFEVVIVLAIVSLLAAIAWPNYTQHIARARRTQAQLDLLEASQYLQRHFAAFNSFRDAALPTVLARSPHTGDAAYALAAAIDDDALGFELSAVPQGRQAGDVCGTLSIRSNGQRRQSASLPLDNCWR